LVEGAVDGQQAYRALLTQFGSEYDGESFSLPVPSEVPVPPEVATASLSSKDRTQTAEFGRGRVAFRWSASDETSPTLPTVATSVRERLAAFIAPDAIVVSRIGVVVTFFAEVQRPGEAIAEAFVESKFRSRALDDIGALEIHVFRMRSLLDRNVATNHWTRVRSVKSSGNEYDAITFEQDLNTRTEDASESRFTIADISGFVSELDEVVERTFLDYWGDATDE
jgi:hypothetical protein